MLFDVCFLGFSDTTILTTQDGEQSYLADATQLPAEIL
jgi:hypothetical protein